MRLAAGAALAFMLLAAGGTRACDLANAPSTRWSMEVGGAVKWLVTPCGDRFFSLGVNVIDGGASSVGVLDHPHYDWRRFAPSRAGWLDEMRTRLSAWGFNSAGAWSLPPQETRLPSVINLELGRIARFHWFDPFEEASAAHLDSQAKTLVAPFRHSPYRIGYFSDNEVGWWSGALFVFYSSKPAQNATKQRWVAELRGIYRDDWTRFTQDFVPPSGVSSFAALLQAESVTKLRPGGEGIKAVRHWTQVVAEHYYRLAAHAIHAADPEALFLGDRLPIYYDPAAIRAEARYVDAIAANYNVDSPEGWVAPYFFDGLRALTGGKPVLVSEWFFAARENRTGNRNNGHLMTVATQAERAKGAARSSALFAAIPEAIGLHWFQYYDYPVGGRRDREDYNFGLVDIDNRPYDELTSAFAAINPDLPALHEASTPPPRQPLDAFTIPKAVIDPAHLSLIDWPKETSLLPPLRASPGEVAFGEAYLSWSPQGIALATIGQDYYDLDLLAYDGDFPLGEAYRLELDIDAGAGPRRFTLYFIPPRTKVKDHPPMAPRLCAGAPLEHAPTSCPPVPGATALYFGADQPRIAAEAILPWSALGLAGPSADHRVRLALSSSAWFHSRWMSLSGRPPAEDSADPTRWVAMRLGE
ncbi:MAG TPA: hypothetical protein VKT70_01720 [Stellaceae bacterium]|nr:hypothetical protein [Stellaceae bacterium]